jgi:molybdopterin converting factor small subunit
MNVCVTLNLLGASHFPVLERTMMFDVPDGALLKEVVELVDSRNPGFRDAVVTPEGNFERRIAVLINGLNANSSGGAGAVLSDGDQINVIPALAGG